MSQRNVSDVSLSCLSWVTDEMRMRADTLNQARHHTELKRADSWSRFTTYAMAGLSGASLLLLRFFTL